MKTPDKSPWCKQHLPMKAPDKMPQGEKHLPMKVTRVKMSTRESPSLKLQGKKHLPVKTPDKSPWGKKHIPMMYYFLHCIDNK